MPNSHSRRRWTFRPLLVVPVLAALGACGIRAPSLPVPGPGELTTRVRALLGGEDRTSDYRRARLELEALGSDLDTILVSIAYDRTARPLARANALLILSERRVPEALAALQWALFDSSSEVIREAAVLGLNRFVADSPEAQAAIRSAVQDPSPRVRLNALQSLEVHDINAIRAMLRTERHPLVREIAVQYLAISESRGAPLLADPDGLFRSAGLEHHARLVLRPDSSDARHGYVVGELGLETPDGGYLPLAYDVEMVNYVLPAFLSADRTMAVIEAGRTIVVRDLERREARYLGPGVAPRLIPFSDSFVYLRERNPPAAEPGTAPLYEVFRVEFADGMPERLGDLQLAAGSEPDGPFSPVRWMTVGENADGWMIKIDGAPVFSGSHRASALPAAQGSGD